MKFREITYTNKYTHYFLAFICLEIFLLIFFPTNRTEVDDGFWYAQGIRDEDYLDLFNPRFFLFLPLVKLLYDGVQLLSFNIDAYYFMCGLTMVFSGLTIVLLYDTLVAQLDLGKRTSLFICLFLLISYEYWRYSYVAEVYVISLFFIIWAFGLFVKLKKDKSIKNIILLSLLCSFTVLLYKPNFIPLFIAFPLIYLYLKKIKQLIIFYITGAFSIIFSFAIVYSLAIEDISFLEYLFGGTNVPVGDAYMSVFVIASNIISVLWLFSFQSAVGFIKNHFPHKVIEEELFLALQIDGAGSIFIICLVVMSAILILLIINAIKRKIYLTAYQKKTMVSVIAWFLIYAAFLMIMDPSSNEPWLMIQAPLIIIISVIIIKPLGKRKLWLAYLALFMLFINNSFGGLWLLKNPKYDYNLAKVEWLRQHSTERDIILSYGPVSLIRHLRYVTNTQVINIE
ncbi:hypothetical protein E1176_05940, partial [Fulvivirga sp. RKSG066]|uniref:hypothetical protein n=1 Tax=Fulvivirga aurantia TaxID=2529383 RepID=UPI001CA411FA